MPGINVPFTTVHTGFIKNHNVSSVQTAKHEFDEGDDIPLSLWARNLTVPGMWDHYVDIDSALLTSEESIVKNNNANEQPKVMGRIAHSNIANDNLTLTMSSIRNKY